MIVADTNLIASLLIQGPCTESAQRLAAKEPDWRVPRLWRYELLNVLATNMKAGIVTFAEAKSVFEAATSIFVTRERDPDFQTVLRLVERHAISGYDATFVALAQELGAPFYTRDKELLRKFPETAFRFGP